MPEATYAVTKFDYETGSDEPLTGTEDWVQVVRLDYSAGYDWTTLVAYYSPSARRYFWHGDSGCSCNDWNTDLYTADDFDNGSRDDLRRAIISFADYFPSCFKASDAINSISTLMTFKEPK